MTQQGDMAILTTEALLGAPDLPEQVVEVPEWGGAVRLRALTVGQLQDVRKRSTVRDEIDGELMDLHFLLEAMVEPRLTQDQLGQLTAKNNAVVSRLVREAVILSNSSPDAIEEAAAGFPEAPTADVGVPVGEGSGDDGGAPPAGDAGV